MVVREALVFLNLFAIGVILAIIAYRVLSVRRNPDRAEPQNLTPFAEDATLETTRLERVLRWALICSAVLAVGLPLYWVLEPSRQEAEEKGFEHRAEERGATLFANDQMEAFDSAKSLACATCHGVKGEGGSAPFTLPATQTGTGRPVQVIWKAPALNTVLSRLTPDQVTQVLNYGRPGTPMAAWGVEGGGPKGEQAISDLVAYLESIQLGDDGAQQQVLDNITALQDEAEQAVKDSNDDLAAARANLADAANEAARVVAESAILAAQQAVTNSRNWLDTVTNASQGELLFDVNCARCHTKGWSYLDPSNASIPLPAPAGSGAFGPSLVDGSTLEQFPGETGVEQQIAWITNPVTEQPDGSQILAIGPNKGYGVRGISSGRMAHFGSLLTAEQIRAIVEYERTL
ncbi:MAG: c-type cytochrome [Acidimicrobiia bacterium]